MGSSWYWLGGWGPHPDVWTLPSSRLSPGIPHITQGKSIHSFTYPFPPPLLTTANPVIVTLIYPRHDGVHILTGWLYFQSDCNHHIIQYESFSPGCSTPPLPTKPSLLPLSVPPIPQPMPLLPSYYSL